MSRASGRPAPDGGRGAVIRMAAVLAAAAGLLAIAVCLPGAAAMPALPAAAAAAAPSNAASDPAVPAAAAPVNARLVIAALNDESTLTSSSPAMRALTAQLSAAWAESPALAAALAPHYVGDAARLRQDQRALAAPAAIRTAIVALRLAAADAVRDHGHPDAWTAAHDANLAQAFTALAEPRLVSLLVSAPASSPRAPSPWPRPLPTPPGSPPPTPPPTPPPPPALLQQHGRLERRAFSLNAVSLKPFMPIERYTRVCTTWLKWGFAQLFGNLWHWFHNHMLEALAVGLAGLIIVAGFRLYRYLADRHAAKLAEREREKWLQRLHEAQRQEAAQAKRERRRRRRLAQRRKAAAAKDGTQDSVQNAVQDGAPDGAQDGA